MATESTFVWDETFVSNSDLSVNGQFQPVKFTANRTIDVCTAATDRTIGILQNKPKAGEAANVRMLGMSKGVSDGSGTAIAAGDFVGTNASGVLVKKATADFGTVGVAVEGSTASGTIIAVIVDGPGFVRTAAG